MALFYGPTVWNGFSGEIHMSPFFVSFRKKLNSYHKHKAIPTLVSISDLPSLWCSFSAPEY